MAVVPRTTLSNCPTTRWSFSPTLLGDDATSTGSEKPSSELPLVFVACQCTPLVAFVSSLIYLSPLSALRLKIRQAIIKHVTGKAVKPRLGTRRRDTSQNTTDYRDEHWSHYQAFKNSQIIETVRGAHRHTQVETHLQSGLARYEVVLCYSWEGFPTTNKINHPRYCQAAVGTSVFFVVHFWSPIERCIIFLTKVAGHL